MNRNSVRPPRRPLDGILLVDKPAGASSNTVLQHVRRLYRAEKAGHTGSLDPLATGLLPVCFGQATKLCGVLLDADKRYLARARVGERTDTGDADGQVTERSDAAALTRAALEQAIPAFTGEILQQPPMYSALKKDGERLYQIARRGETVERPARRLFIHSLQLTAFGDGFFELDVRCSKGTYIRTLVEDLARAAGQCAHITALRRLESGPFSGPMHTLDNLEQAARKGPDALDGLLRPMLDGLAGWRRETVTGEQARKLHHGQAVDLPGACQPGAVAVLGPEGALLGLGEVDARGRLQPRTWISGGGGSP